MSQYDYIVIGAGSSGCVVASRLSERVDIQVLLLEAGGSDENFPAIHDPGAWTTALQGTEIDWQYKTIPQEHTAGRIHEWPRGKVLGGTSCLNAMVYVRGHRTDFDNWAYWGCVGWDYASVLPLFRKSEDHLEGANEYHGVGGPLSTRRSGPENANPVSAACIDAALEVGYPRTDDFNGHQMQGTGWNTVTITRDNKRANTAACFLRNTGAVNRPNLTITTHAQARRLLITGGRCTGVEYTRNGTLERAEARQEVVVCSGSIDSPRLLLLSGIGPADDLRKLGLKVEVDLPGVGQNLHDHLLIGVVYEAAKPMEVGKSNLSESTLFWFTDGHGHGIVPGMQIQFIHIPFAPVGFQAPDNGYTITPGNNRVLSRGYIRLRSANPDDMPEINPNYLAEASDVQELVRGIQMSREIGEANALKEWRKQEVLPGKAVHTNAELRDFVAHAASTIYHPVGTCKMGIDHTSVVDPNLRVYGIEGLRVADGSIMPSITSGNTNAPIIMIGEKAAELILSSVGVAEVTVTHSGFPAG